MISLSETLRHQFPLEKRRVLKRPRQAAVLIPLIEDEHEPRFLLTRRSTSLSSHKGEVAFPGGMHDPQDKNLIQTALREAYEEVALPSQYVDVLGLLDDCLPKSEKVAVSPVLGIVNPLPPLQANPSEVDRIFDVPVSKLLEKERWSIEWVIWRGKQWPIYYFDYDGEKVWGLTAHLLLTVLQYTPYGSPLELPKTL